MMTGAIDIQRDGLAVSVLANCQSCLTGLDVGKQNSPLGIGGGSVVLAPNDKMPRIDDGPNGLLPLLGNFTLDLLGNGKPLVVGEQLFPIQHDGHAGVVVALFVPRNSDVDDLGHLGFVTGPAIGSSVETAP